MAPTTLSMPNQIWLDKRTRFLNIPAKLSDIEARNTMTNAVFKTKSITFQRVRPIRFRDCFIMDNLPSLHHHPHHTRTLSQFTANHRRSALVPRELRCLRRRKRADPTLAATLRYDSLAAASLSAVQSKIAIMMIRNTLQLSQQALVSVFVIGASHSLVVMNSEDNHSTSDTGRRTETIMCTITSSIASSRKSSPSTGERACHQSKSIFVHFFVINMRIKSTLKTTIQPIWIQTPFAPPRYSSLSAVVHTRSFSLPKLPLSAS